MNILRLMTRKINVSKGVIVITLTKIIFKCLRQYGVEEGRHTD